MEEDFKKVANKWAEKTLKELPKTTFEETANQLQEFIILGNLIYDEQSNWIPRLTPTDNILKDEK